MPNKYGTGLPGTEGYMTVEQRKRKDTKSPTSRVERNNDNRMGQTSRAGRPVREDDMGWNPGTMGNRQGRVPPVRGGRTISYPSRPRTATGSNPRGNPTKQMVNATRMGANASRQVGSQPTGLQKAAMRRMKKS